MLLSLVFAVSLSFGSLSGVEEDSRQARWSGHAAFHGVESRVRLLTGIGTSTYALQVEGRIRWEVLVVEDRVWTSERGAPFVEAELLDREVALFEAFVWTGGNSAPWMEVSEVPGSKGCREEWQIEGGELKAQAHLDDAGRVRELKIPGAREGRRWTFEWPFPHGFELPGARMRALLRTDDGLTHTFVFDEVSEAVGALPGAPESHPLDVVFDGSQLREISVRRAPSGHLFVRPLVNGRDLGWWLFDSGAGGTMLAAEAIEALELERFGEARLTGFGPDVHETSFVQLESVKLGSLEIRDLVALERAGPSMASRILGEPVAGVLGWDVFLRSVVTIDPAEGTVRVENPDAFDGGELDWQRLTLHWNVPYVTARFEGDREELFCLDTGAGSKSVIFHADAVERLGLLDGRETTTFQGGGAGGAVAMKSGELEWFEIAGVRHEPAPAIFSAGEDGESDPYTAGFLGAGFLGDVKVVYDYGRKRVAFVPRD